ncbi:MAG: hypothetical protein AAGA60_06050 [Cyanobacteria bacterium P01_E01_bin.42]
MIGSIKKMFSGEDSYYLKLNESEAGTSEAPAPVVEAKPEPVKVETQPEATPTPIAEKSSKKTEKKKAAAKAVPTPAPVTSASSGYYTLDLIRTAVQKPTPQAEMNGQSNGQGSEPTFAPDYLLYTRTQPKRRPGACMSPFMDMVQNMSKRR